MEGNIGSVAQDLTKQLPKNLKSLLVRAQRKAINESHENHYVLKTDFVSNFVDAYALLGVGGALTYWHEVPNSAGFDFERALSPGYVYSVVARYKSQIAGIKRV